ncbi:hypothetical protein F0U61_26315 [Archangium violaceum]|uniref:hypothetical protein n=1 Tax=Archangium violaceum TaxID=83451 RepID=UPI002B2E0394|nr:hypothetical protein F0U61_26315 [Archangium violaceum]
MSQSESSLDLLKRIRARSGASLAECSQALKEAQGDPRLALNQLASKGYTGGRPRYDEPAPLGSYGFDSYAQRIIDACVNGLEEYLRPDGEPIGAVVLHALLGIPVSVVLVHGERGLAGKARVSVDVAPDPGAIPPTPGDQDLLLETFRYRFGFQETRPDVGLFDEEPLLSWEVSSLPDSLYCHEMMRAAASVARRLAADGYRVAPGCVAGYARQDLVLSDAEDQLALVRRQLKSLMREPDTLRAFAGLCYASAEGQRYLMELATGA